MSEVTYYKDGDCRFCGMSNTNYRHISDHTYSPKQSSHISNIELVTHDELRCKHLPCLACVLRKTDR
jgi:hypothetical protein